MSYWFQRGLNNGATPYFELFQAFGVNGAAFAEATTQWADGSEVRGGD